LDINFAQELTDAGGHFIYCESEGEFLEGLRFLIQDRKWGQVFAMEPRIAEILKNGQLNFSYFPDDLLNAHVGVTGCEALVARLGSIMVSSGQLAGRRTFVYPEIHIILAYTSQVVADLKDAFAKFRKKYEPRIPSMATFITGPSRTADIEKTLVIGVHGPKEIYVFLLEDRQ
jgi:L-lactate dehydrogenase complex protein LldG